MIKSDFPNIDWANEDVSRLVEIFSEKFDVNMSEKDKIIDQQAGTITEQAGTITELTEQNTQLTEQNTQLTEQNTQLTEQNTQQAEEIEQLKQQVADLKSIVKRKSRKSRSFNTRKFKKYPRPEGYSKRTRPEDIGYKTGMQATVRQVTVDLQYCPIHGVLLSEGASTYGRTTEDVTDGKWTKTEWTVKRRYCKECCKQHSAPVPGVLPKEYFGTTVMAQVFCIRCLGIPFDKIQKIIHMLYGRFIEISNLIHICDTVADQCDPIYKELLKLINLAEILWGDDTGWFFNKAHWYVWVFISKHTVLYHLSASRSKTVAEAILEGFKGIITGDSHPAWNDIGSETQRCLLHYFKDMYKTLEDNNSAEFTSFFNKLHAILKSAINSGIKYAAKDSEVPKSVITKLQNRIDRLIEQPYTDADCKRYVKRLRRERLQLLTFLKYDNVTYHNNTSERRLRPFALMRKVTYGSRSIRGIKTTETLMTIYATCDARGINPYTFMIDYLNGSTDSIPMPEQEQQSCKTTTVAAQ